MIPDVNKIAQEQQEKHKELRRMRRLANQMVEIGARDFRGPIEETTLILQAKKELKRKIKQIFS